MHSFFTLTHYNATHEGGRKRHQSVTGNGQPHTYKEKNKTLKKHQHRIIKLTQMHSFSLLHTITRVTTLEEKSISLLREKGNHTHAKKKIQHLKNTNTE